MSDTTVIQSIAEELADAGYSPYIDQLDTEVVEKIPCPRCRGTQMAVGFKRDDPRSYRAFAVCLQCDTAEEF